MILYAVKDIMGVKPEPGNRTTAVCMEGRRSIRMRRPRIAVPEIGQDVTNYTRGLFAAGMEPVVISIEKENTGRAQHQEYLDYAQFRAEAYDGCLLPGGGDIHPKRYGQAHTGESILINEALDELQFSVLDAFVKAGKPVLGICRGLQLINVYYGGTLIQHLPTYTIHTCMPYAALQEMIRKEKGTAPDAEAGRARQERELAERVDAVLREVKDARHECRAEKDSWLEMLYAETFCHNSSHHQAVDILGEGLVADSRCPWDGVIEALHHREHPVYAVQWHPERMCLDHERIDTASGLPVLQFLCRLCGGNPEVQTSLEQGHIMTDRMGL